MQMKKEPNSGCLLCRSAVAATSSPTIPNLCHDEGDRSIGTSSPHCQGVFFASMALPRNVEVCVKEQRLSTYKHVTSKGDNKFRRNISEILSYFVASFSLP